ncbi:hypothetical protein P280DRAFT_50710 [Massarina eburnea CBS 473.64]|uniref:Zn(2)-C6 fungal-type domain-containing protein n=1 Tax=Massarina eburnea CBS 473.64 TaxID=1395130 RepID=A0A6A6S060_9PLEO|nr:hypothetical protein P280DRAFT_50710 [Massarina eburnea CBS 473.64]
MPPGLSILFDVKRSISFLPTARVDMCEGNESNHQLADKGSKKSNYQRAACKRSKGGCQTCKRRRVKCDETHPRCLRCTKTRLHCEGYPTPVSKSTGRTTELAILPRPEVVPNVTQLTTTQPSALLLGETEVEHRYLRYFQHETTSGFESAWDWTIWNRLVLQGVHHEDFIRQAVVAIGALHKSLRTQSSTGKGSVGDESDYMAKLHREFAYRTYGKALKNMQRAVDGNDGRAALLACLLVVCFESHTGNRYKALSHAKYGLQILHQWTDRLKSVEEEIVDAFKNLDIQITTINDHRTPESHRELIAEDLPFVQSMPTQFGCLDEVKRYWSAIFRRSCHFLATTWSRTESQSLTREFCTEIPGSVTSLEKEQKQFGAELDRWLEAFHPIFTKIRQSDGVKGREYISVSVLRIQALTAKITLAGVVFTQEILYDQFYTEFAEIISLSHDVAGVRHSNPKADFWTGSFLLDLGLNAPLFYLTLRCRDPMLRREAIAILNSWHVECWWDPLLVASIGQFAMELEEGGMVDGLIPETSRAILTAKCHCPPERSFLIQFVQRTEAGLKWTEGWIHW